MGDILLGELSGLNVASKEWVIRQYDHEVQGGSVIKPLVGPGQGPSDAAVVRPRLNSDRGVVLACGLRWQADGEDPYEMAVDAVDEALRNTICVGGDPRRTAILDNFCWGEVESPHSLGGLVRACRGAHDAAVAYGLPFISGKDSLNNCFTQTPPDAAGNSLPELVSIPGTLLISAVSVIENVGRCVTMDLKRSGSRLVCVGGFVTAGDLQSSADLHFRVADWIGSGAVLSAHDVSDGGVAVAIAEMCIASELGVTVDLDCFANGVEDDELLFGERRCCYILECDDGSDIGGPGVVEIGMVEQRDSFLVRRKGETLISLSLAVLADAWRNPLASVGEA